MPQNLQRGNYTRQQMIDAGYGGIAPNLGADDFMTLRPDGGWSMSPAGEQAWNTNMATSHKDAISRLNQQNNAGSIDANGNPLNLTPIANQASSYGPTNTLTPSTTSPISGTTTMPGVQSQPTTTAPLIGGNNNVQSLPNSGSSGGLMPMDRSQLPATKKRLSAFGALV